MTARSDHIAVDPFDREYGLADLLPVALAQELLADLDSRCTAAVMTADGRLYYPGGERQPDAAAELKRRGQPDETAPQLFSVNDRRAGTFILTHELETIGFLVLETDGERGLDDDLLLSMGGLAARCVNRIINLNYRNRMTAGLHGRVVADSYESLKIKAEQLARSEEKYRLLAENLEIEVQNKTREIRDAQLRLLQQEKMASIGQLAAGIAHEINNPVGFVISNLNTLRSGSENLINLIGSYRQLTNLLTDRTGDGRQVERIKTRMAAIDRLIEDIDLDFVLEDTLSLIDESLDGAKRVKIIVQNLRDFTHPSVETAESVDFNSCLETTLAMLSSHAMPRLKVSRRYGAIPQVTCRLREVNQVFYNILRNAFQALGEQGELTIRTAVDDEIVCVSITDTGTGIDPAHLSSIFNPFFTTREVGSGIGLGLFQAYTTVKSHGGTIDVKSEAGKGTTFTVRFPIEGTDRE